MGAPPKPAEQVNGRRRRPLALFALATASFALLVALPRVSAHEVPNDVTIRAFLKAEGPRLLVLVRVPLIAMRDMTWPLRAPGLLDLARATPELGNGAMLWLGAEAVVYEGGEALPAPTVTAVRASLQRDRSFESYDQALALVTGAPEPETTDVTIKDDFLDVLFEYPIRSEESRFSIEPRWAGLGLKTLTILRLVSSSGERRFELEGDPGLVRLDPTRRQAVSQFVGLGIRHLLGGGEPLLFLLCLVLPFRRVSDVAILIVPFTVAVSTTFMASAHGYAPDALWFRPLIDTLIAATMVYLAAENMVGVRVERRWREAVWFGLIFGCAFAFPLHPTLQLAGAHVGWSLVSFDLGIGVGELIALAVLVPLAALLFRFVVSERIGTILASAVAGHTAWHWLTARVALLWQYRFAPPALDAAFFAEFLRGAIFVVAVAGIVWLVSTIAETRRDKSVPTRPSRASRS